MQAQFRPYTLTGNDSVYTGTSTQLAELDVQRTRTSIWRPGGTGGVSAWAEVHHQGPQDLIPVLSSSYSPHKDGHPINFTASLCVCRCPRSAARTRTQHVVNTRCSSHSSEPMPTCLRCVFTAQEFVSLAAEWSFWPLFFSQIKQKVPYGGKASGCFPDIILPKDFSPCFLLFFFFQPTHKCQNYSPPQL